MPSPGSPATACSTTRARDSWLSVDDVWSTIGSNFSDAMKKASTGPDGKMYLVLNYNYPWGFFYRKSFWAEKGYAVPKTFDELKTLATKMKSDGIIPIGFADKDGWPAMGTFDYINMRLNGYQFHIDLTAHKESWDQKKVSNVFDTWKALLPFQDPAALGQTWQDAAKALEAKKTGMYLLGSFVTQQFTDPAVLADIDFFPFPEIAMEGTDAVEAPIDGLLLSKKGGDNKAAHDFLAFMGSAEGQNAYAAVDTSNIATAKGADTSKFSPLNKKCADTIANAKYISQFLDPRCSPRHGQQRDDPCAAVLHQGRQRGRQEPRSAGKDPLRRPVAAATVTRPRRSPHSVPAPQGQVRRRRHRPPSSGRLIAN
ncbi:ABC transporter substrate-binding protein [Arthrobacter sp. NA-172]|uniref:ABC transporter substrate-binding protein n=1 Tax=Arthrobacter sp. NA-172 TaxID=3367524 RepID=UPI003754875F